MLQTASDSSSRREQILASALRLFGVHGMHNVTTRQIAAAVGISQPSLYAHFATRDAIGVELCRRAFTQLRACLVSAIDFNGPPKERLYQLGLNYIAFGLENEAAYRVAFMTPMPTGMHESIGTIMQAGLSAFDVLRGLFAEVLGDDNQEIDLRAQSCWASVHGIVALKLDRPEFPWQPRQCLIQAHLRRLTTAAFQVL